ncbi:hypothetical protein MD484_g2236, partial [Candolleomyces efflorescens]
MNVLGGSQNAHVGQLTAYQIDGAAHFHGAQVRTDDLTVYELLKPIDDASHTRDRRKSPPDSACARGTRVEVVKKYTSWTTDKISSADEPHVLWVHGYAGCGKSAISQEVCDTSKRQGRPVVSFFFFRNAGERSKIRRLANTLATQMVMAVPETEPFVRAAVKANMALLDPDQPGVSLRERVEQLVYGPFKAAVELGSKVRHPASSVWSLATLMQRFVSDRRINNAQETPNILESLSRGPFLIVIDGLDECDDKEEVQELVDGMLAFFDQNPLIPLRVFITSRVEQHIRSRLDVPGVRLYNLVDHCSDDDIATFIDVLFESEGRRDPVIRAFILEHGKWPAPDERLKLIKHIGGSFIFGWTVFRFIMGSMNEPGSPATPMERLPLALEMNPGLDGLYTQTLARSQHLPHFINIISTIALIEDPLPTSGIAELLGIKTYEVVNVLMNLQAIIQVPGTDDIPVTLFHTSLRDFLTTLTRSGPFFAHPRHHVFLFLRCLQCELAYRQRGVGLPTYLDQRKPAAAYALRYAGDHLERGEHLFESGESNSAIRLCREALESCPGAPELIVSLARVTLRHATHGGTLTDLDEAVSLNRTALTFRGPSHPDRPQSLLALGDALFERSEHQGSISDLNEAIFLYGEELDLRPNPHPDRARSLQKLGFALGIRYERAGTPTDLEQSISLLREGLQLRSPPHPDRAQSLKNLGEMLWRRYHYTKIPADLKEVISLFQEAINLQPPPHPYRSSSLNELGITLLDRYKCTGMAADLEESMSVLREALELRPVPHPDRWSWLNNLAVALNFRYQRTGAESDIEQAISLLSEALELRPSPHSGRSAILGNLGNALEQRHQRTKNAADTNRAISMYREALELRPPPHAYRSTYLNNLGYALYRRHQQTRIGEDIDEAISTYREVLELQPPPHPDRPTSLNSLGNALYRRHQQTRVVADIDEAIYVYREVLELQPLPHPYRSTYLNNLGYALYGRHQQTRIVEDIDEAISMYREVLELQPPPHPDRPTSLNKLGNALYRRHQQTRVVADIDEAIYVYREVLELQPLPHPYRSTYLNNLGYALYGRHQQTRIVEDIDEAISMYREVLELQPPPHPDRPTTLNNLGSVLCRRHQQTIVVADIDEAISTYREVLEVQPLPHPDRATSLNNLGITLYYRNRQTRVVADIDEAILAFREVLDLRALPHPDRSASLNWLDNALWNRYLSTKDRADLEEAIRFGREALDLQPSPHPYRAGSLRNLVITLNEMYEVSLALAYLQEAISLCEELLASHYPVGHENRLDTLNRLVSLLQKRSSANQSTKEDNAWIAKLQEEGLRLSTATATTWSKDSNLSQVCSITQW